MAQSHELGAPAGADASAPEQRPERNARPPKVALPVDEPSHVRVARSREAEIIREPRDAAADLGDRHRLVVQPSDGGADGRVVPRGARGHVAERARSFVSHV